MTEPYLTANLPGIGGTIKETPDDFRVDEIPAYLPSGEGEHLYIDIEKKHLTTLDLLRKAATLFSVPERDIGYAGLKDARATTRQTISVPLVSAADAEKLNDENITVLSAIRHKNKLRTGHLLGNRFRIRIHGVDPDTQNKTKAIIDELVAKGVPNRFGRQRYGSLGNSHLIGRALINQDYDNAIKLIIGDPAIITNERWKQAALLFQEEKITESLAALPGHCRYERTVLKKLAAGKSSKQAIKSLPRSILRLYLSACQSFLFDRVVTMRLATLDRVWQGDFAFKHDNGACFFVEDAEVENDRAKRFEISPSGPIYGYKSTLSRGQSGIIEESLLESEGLKLKDFCLGGGLDMPGERRPLRVVLQEPEFHTEKDDLMISFALSSGSYATSVLREITKIASL
jgi:tRNA pseudouridine13 synthase